MVNICCAFITYILFIVKKSNENFISHMKVALDVIDEINLSNTDNICADRGYDSDALRPHIEQEGCFNHIPRK